MSGTDQDNEKHAIPTETHAGDTSPPPAKGIEVTLDAEDDPKNLPIYRKWLVVVTISSAAFCVACASSMASFTEDGISKSFGISDEVAILSISLYVAGLGTGPLLLGPLSEFYGRNAVYWVSYFIFWAFIWPTAFAPDAAVHLLFRFLDGFAGAAFLSVAGGSVSDLFDNASVGLPMACYTLSPFLGPVFGPLISGFINQNTTWRWAYWTLAIWSAVEWIALLVFVPETYTPTILQRKARRLRKSTGDESYYAPLDREERSLLGAIMFSIYKPFEILIREPMALLLDMWCALLLGILYLAFQAFPIIFEKNHGFNEQMTGLSFLGIGIGMIGGVFTQPRWTRLYQSMADSSGRVPPEAQLRMGQAGAILVPLSLIWLAFTTYPHVHWIAPIIASIPFGLGVFYVFTAVFTYLVTTYRPLAASAMAGNSALRSAFAAGFPLFAPAMYARLGTVGATGLLAGLTALMAPLPFVFYKLGPRLRKNSRFAVV